MRCVCKRKPYLVTGATGFLGSHVLEALMPNKDIHLIAACRNPSKLLPDFDGEVRQGDLTDSTYVRQLTQGVDVICHAAAWTSLWAHRKEEQRFYREPTKELIEAAIKSGVQRFIFDSSVVAVGPHRDGHPLVTMSRQSIQDSGRIWISWSILSTPCASKQGEAQPWWRCAAATLPARVTTWGLLSLLLPRLKTHLVPWVAGGKARVPLVDGERYRQRLRLGSKAEGLEGFESFNICGPSFPTMREVIDFLHTESRHTSTAFRCAAMGRLCVRLVNGKAQPATARRSLPHQSNRLFR